MKSAILILNLLTVFVYVPAKNMSTAVHRVFVYGTLKKGEPNHNWFTKEKDAYHKFLFNARTVEKLPLIIGTKYNIPFLLYSPGNGNNVHGEVYEVDDKVLAKLDILEEHPDYYTRDLYDVERLDGDKEISKVWIYVIKRFKTEFLNRPTFESYSSQGNHGLRYVESEDSTLEDLNGPRE